MTKDKALTGAAGEYYVAFRLAAEGYAVGLTPSRTMSIDLIATNPKTGKSITIQTKTGWEASHGSGAESWWKWPVGKPRQPQKTFFYAFVDLKNDPSKTPDVFIVPSEEVTPPLLQEYRVGSWLVIEDEEDVLKYRDGWKIIYDALV